MCEENIQKAIQAFEDTEETLFKIAMEVSFEELGETLFAILIEVVNAVIPVIKAIYVCMNNKKVSKCLHIWIHTKNDRIRKKQMKRINNFILDEMSL